MQGTKIQRVAGAVAALMIMGALQARADAVVGVLEVPLAPRQMGDLREMTARRQIRVLVVPSPTHYFVERGAERGVIPEAFRLFEERLNRRRAKAERVHVAFVPVARSELLQALNDGRGDVAAVDLTVTAEREKIVSFTRPLLADVREIVVTGASVSGQLLQLRDLSGRTVHVRRGTSQHESLLALNERLRRSGEAPMKLAPLPDDLESEDVLDMLDSGQIEISVLEQHLADRLEAAHPQLVLRRDLAVRDGARIAWAVRRSSPALRKELDRFLAREFCEGSAARNLLARRYLDEPAQASSLDADARGFASTRELFEKYGTEYGLHPFMLMAQAYQESGIDQSRRSPRGAVGIMQLMPATARSLGVGDIRDADANVHAGARYLRQLIDEYFDGPQLSDLDRVLFAWAAYNAGPARIAGLREEAARAGRDPDVWFGQVERIAARRIGPETVQYVRSVYRRYVAYRLEAEASAARAAARARAERSLGGRSLVSEKQRGFGPSAAVDRCAPLALLRVC